ncbi:uncharacterized protein GGS22DRAFT_176097 [Annulohypoxylon maeteangense]|uniref:uncharacterized protein n=1 Tax=Annulohypoxylon maeteangense TaxID=1927788 RepID=UPI00200852AD|nr:uncharacterized protein GGS22DRAFT_176097 [Annulohypoxylon maeteangense]KAI0880071.1 hypothetical protein GGS22DRAFT_176097 [Annulohypoxylon maeteangense]
MTSDVNISRRPSLEPLWTNYRNHDSLPDTVFRPTPISVSMSQPPLSPKSLPGPSPVHPASYDKSMRKQDRALVDSFDQRTRHVVGSAPLTPIDEYSPSPLVARLEKISILPPMSVPHGLPTPASPSLPRRDSLGAVERSDSMGGVSGSRDRSPYYYTRDELPISPRIDSVSGIHDQLRSWGHVYYGNAKTADAFIIARSLRRRSSDSLTDIARPELVKATASAPMKNRLTVRAIVRPRALDRPSFLIQRNFDIDELRATTPDPTPKPQVRSPNEWRRPSLPSISSRSGTPSPRSRRSSSVRSGALLRSSTNSLDLDSLIRDAKAVPIHLKYVRVYLPVIAALLVSGHVHEGDIIYLPMPHAESWPQTAQYVYTGQGELTKAIRENILYLAGKV